MSKNKILFLCFVFAAFSIVAQKNVIKKYTNKKDKYRCFVPLAASKVPYIPCDSAKFYKKEFFASDCEFWNPRPDSVFYSVQSFYIDKRYVSNKDYREFVKYVQDSILRDCLGYFISHGEYGEQLDWKRKINYKDSIVTQECLRNYSKTKMGYRLNPQSLSYRYWWIDFESAAKVTKKDTSTLDLHSWKYIDVYPTGISDRSQFIKMEELSVYPDTLIWMKDTINNLSMEEKIMLSRFYFSDPTFDNSPVIGLSQAQVKAYLHWVTDRVNHYLQSKGKPIVNDYRLPTFEELAFTGRLPDGFILDSLQDSIVVKAKNYARYLYWCQSNQISSISFLKEDYHLKNLEIDFEGSVLPSAYTDLSTAISQLNKLKNTNIKVSLSYNQAIAFFYWEEMKLNHFYGLLPTKEEYETGKFNSRELDVVLPSRPFRPAQTFLGRKKRSKPIH
jgi:hypothetical protein